MFTLPVMGLVAQILLQVFLFSCVLLHCRGMQDNKYLTWVDGVDRNICHEGTVSPSDRIFYPHHTPMIDTFSCIPFDLPHLIFKVELDIK